MNNIFMSFANGFMDYPYKIPINSKIKWELKTESTICLKILSSVNQMIKTIRLIEPVSIQMRSNKNRNQLNAPFDWSQKSKLMNSIRKLWIAMENVTTYSFSLNCGFYACFEYLVLKVLNIYHSLILSISLKIVSIKKQ